MIAAIHSHDTLIRLLSGRLESNRVAQYEGREYQIVKAIAKRWGLENVNEELEGIGNLHEKQRIRSVRALGDSMYDKKKQNQNRITTKV